MYRCDLLLFFFLNSADTSMHMETIRMATYTRGRRLSTMSHITTGCHRRCLKNIIAIADQHNVCAVADKVTFTI